MSRERSRSPRPNARAAASSSVSPAPSPVSSNVAEEHAECCICFDPLHSQPLAVLTHQQRRSCRHFFHKTCLSQVVSANAQPQKCCPLCRTEYDGILPVPSICQSPRAWFDLVDFDGNGSLDATELLEVFRAALPLDNKKLEKDMPSLFAQWDRNGDGHVGYDEIFGEGGLFAFIKETFRAGQQSADMPNIKQDRAAWFRYWDEDLSGSLDREEVVRSLVKTFKMSSTPEQIRCLRELLEVFWPDFDPRGVGSIDQQHFCRNDGLADMIIMNLRLQ